MNPIRAIQSLMPRPSVGPRGARAGSAERKGPRGRSDPGGPLRAAWGPHHPPWGKGRRPFPGLHGAPASAHAKDWFVPPSCRACQRSRPGARPRVRHPFPPPLPFPLPSRTRSRHRRARKPSPPLSCPSQRDDRERELFDSRLQARGAGGLLKPHSPAGCLKRSRCKAAREGGVPTGGGSEAYTGYAAAHPPPPRRRGEMSEHGNASPAAVLPAAGKDAGPFQQPATGASSRGRGPARRCAGARCGSRHRARRP